MRARPLLAVLLALLAATAFAACGGASSSSTTSSASPSGSSTAATTPPEPSEHSASSVASETAAARRAAGRAAPFIRPKADNSVPTFGSEASASERNDAETALKAYLRAREKGNWATACRYLAVPTRQGFEKLAKSGINGCAPILAALSKGADRTDPLTADLLSLRVKGANAFALFYGPARQQYIVPMRREAPGWRLTQTAPIAYPPAAPPGAP